ncbi:hypothetical protein HK096_009889 [Nowakowskiella sp. JEL0078]|nr:hypothetical protein HK096_009889 [Nowakowskiella sp. JEL0078]
MQMLEYPELHHDSLGLASFYRLVYALYLPNKRSKMFLSFGVEDFSLRDLIRPEPGRLRRILSSVINFAKFREERVILVETSHRKANELNSLNQIHQQRHNELADQVNSIKLKLAEQEPELHRIRESNSSLTNDLRELKKVQTSIVSEIDSLKKEKTNLEENLVRCFKGDRLQSRVVQSPEQLKQAIQDLNARIISEKSNVIGTEKRVRELQMKIEVLDTLEKDITSCIKLMEDCDLEIKKSVEAVQKLALDREAIESKQAELREQLLRQNVRSEDKIARLQKHQSSKQDTATTKKDKLLLELAQINAERELNIKKANDINRSVNETEVKANKDEALRCLEISKTKFGDGNSEAAVKFAKKSIALCETPEATSWLDFLSKHGSSSSTPSSSTEGVRKRTTASSSSPVPETLSEEARPYTPEQESGVKRIKACKTKGNLYAILGLEKGCSDSDIKKSYRKLALQFHPDKCNAPGTDEAFKAIGHAMAVLSDPDKRDKYDRYGIDSESRAAASSSTSSPFARGGFNPDFENEISPEDLFNMFFGEMAGGGFGGATFTTGGPGFRFNSVNPQFRQQQRARAQPQSGMAQFIQILPLLFLGLVTVLSWLTMEPEPVFSFNPTPSFKHERFTEKMNVRYFVNPRGFSSQGYEPKTYKLRNFENSVETRWLEDLETKCHQEYNHRAMMIQSARGLFSVDEARLKEAKSKRLYKCEERQEFIDRLAKLNLKRGRRS